MTSQTNFAAVTASIRSVSASMEARFLDMGDRLGAAVETIATLTQTFDRLAAELNGEALLDATMKLSQIMARFIALARVHDDGRAAFTHLAALTSRIQQRVGQIGKAVDGIGMLAINARIEAVNIGNADLDLAAFTTEISRTLQLAQGSLEQFTGELGGVGNHVRLAAASQLVLAQHQAEAIRSIPVRLTASIDAITDRGNRAVAAALAVAQKSRQVGQSISDAVMALQVGDTTRQRLEHVETALGIVTRILTPPDDAKPAEPKWTGPKWAGPKWTGPKWTGPKPDAPKWAGPGGDWSALSGPQRHALAALCGGLLSAQLLDAADEFDDKMREILSSIQALAAESEDILRLGATAAGAPDDRRGTFLNHVEAQVAEVGVLLEGLATARQQADGVAASVSEATTRLVSHTTTLTWLEEDIRIMGLNTSLKCGRLGTVGRPLMVIAQELRSYAARIAAEASAITTDLAALVEAAGSLSGGRQAESMADIADITAIMADSVAHLGTAGERLADALATLARDTEGVATKLRDTVARATTHEELSRIVRQAAADLGSTLADSLWEDDIVAPEADHMMALVMRLYTMERERIVHGRHARLRPGATAIVPAGIVPAGIVPAGIVPAGIAPAGVVPAGIAPAGVVPADIAPAGVPPAGIAPIGIAPIGIAPIGIAPIGIAPIGIAPIGIAPIGIAPIGIERAAAADLEDVFF
jgi:hypothetical protein